MDQKVRLGITGHKRVRSVPLRSLGAYGLSFSLAGSGTTDAGPWNHRSREGARV